MRKQVLRFLPFLLIALLLSACQFPLDDGTSAPAASAGNAVQLPADIVADTLRTGEGTFTFKSLVPVEVSIDFSLYAADSAQGVTQVVFSDGTTQAVPQVYVTLTDSHGGLLYSGAAAADGVFETVLYLPAAPETMELTVQAQGYETRRVKIEDMARYAAVTRTMSLMREQAQSGLTSSLQSTGVGPLVDSDRDGVPDIYDLYPDDPSAAFAMSVPSEESITVAYEDLFGHANAGDADYNDFIASYGINEIMNGDGLVTRIEIQAKALEKLAGYNHAFGIRIDSFEGKASLTGSFINRAGNTARLARRLEAPAEIKLFVGTESAVGQDAYFVLEFDTPQLTASDPENPGTAVLSRPPYNPFLYVFDTRHDIHLIDAEPLSRSINPNDSFVDADGFPWALLVPADWTPPAEGQRIEALYPLFTDWRESGGLDARDWYEQPYDPNDPGGTAVSAYLAGYYNSGSADTAAYWVDDGSTVTRTDLPAGGAARATDIYVDDSGSVYVSGFYNNGSEYAAVYWKDGVRSVDLGGNGRATGIAVDSSGTVYVSGYYGSSPKKAVYWKDDGTTVQEVVLNTGSISAEATGIAVSGTGTVYISGTYINSSSAPVTAYWVDDASGVVDLVVGAGSNAKGIWSDGTDTYVAGRYVYAGPTAAAAYWQSGGTAAVELNTSVGQAYGITSGNGGVYAAGTYNNGGVMQAAWWLNDAAGQTDLDGDVSGYATYAYGIAVDGTDVYVAGTQDPGNGEEAVYWKNGAMTALEPGVPSSANAVYLAP